MIAFIIGIFVGIVLGGLAMALVSAKGYNPFEEDDRDGR